MQYAVYRSGSSASPLFTGSKTACLEFMRHALKSCTTLIISKFEG